MSASLRALLGQSLDYAGLFAPAGLPLDEALQNYWRYQEHENAWLLGRFVCPATKLGELAPLWPERGGLRLVALSSPASGAVEQILAGLEMDWRAIAALQAHNEAYLRVEVYETRLPPHFEEPLFTSFLTRLYQPLADAEWTPNTVFVEAATLSDLRAVLPIAAELRSQFGQEAIRVGWKLRFANSEGVAPPGPAEVAQFIARCREFQFPWKATAGLHAAMTSFNSAEHCYRIGFLNLFSAAVLGAGLSLEPAEIESILTETRPEAFCFDDREMSWRERSLSAQRVSDIRHESLISFGSCSFDEPVEDLRELGLLSIAAANR